MQEKAKEPRGNNHESGPFSTGGAKDFANRFLGFDASEYYGKILRGMNFEKNDGNFKLLERFYNLFKKEFGGMETKCRKEFEVYLLGDPIRYGLRKFLTNPEKLEKVVKLCELIDASDCLAGRCLLRESTELRHYKVQNLIARLPQENLEAVARGYISLCKENKQVGFFIAATNFLTLLEASPEDATRVVNELTPVWAKVSDPNFVDEGLPLISSVVNDADDVREFCRIVDAIVTSGRSKNYSPTGIVRCIILRQEAVEFPRTALISDGVLREGAVDLKIKEVIISKRLKELADDVIRLLWDQRQGFISPERVKEIIGKYSKTKTKP